MEVDQKCGKPFMLSEDGEGGIETGLHIGPVRGMEDVRCAT
jgi:hypothetical protein